MSFPEQFGTQRITLKRNLGMSSDSVVNYEASAGVESTTIYIFRASLPNAALWFERAISTAEREIPIGIFIATPDEPVLAFAAPQPVGVRRLYVTDQQGPFRTTSMTVVQRGPWLIKMRATSSTLDVAGLRARIDNHLGAIKLPTSLEAAVDLSKPTECGAITAAAPDASVVPEATREAAVASSLPFLVEASSVNPVAARYCRRDDPAMRTIGTLLERTDDISGWTLLIGDAGAAIAAVELAGSPADVGRFVTVSVNPDSIKGVAIYGSRPAPSAALAPAVMVMTKRAPALFEITASQGRTSRK